MIDLRFLLIFYNQKTRKFRLKKFIFLPFLLKFSQEKIIFAYLDRARRELSDHIQKCIKKINCGRKNEFKKKKV